MEITLNHTIIPTFDNIETANFYVDIFDFKFIKVWGHFAVVKVNSSLTFDFVTKTDFPSSHFAFKVSDKEFDVIFDKVKEANITFGSGPNKLKNRKINTLDGGRGVYFKDINGHVLEILTKDYDLNRDF